MGNSVGIPGLQPDEDVNVDLKIERSSTGVPAMWHRSVRSELAWSVRAAESAERLPGTVKFTPCLGSDRASSALPTYSGGDTAGIPA